MVEKAEIEKFVRAGITCGQMPSSSDHDVSWVCDLSFESILFGWIKNKELVAVHTFPLFKVTDDALLKSSFDFIMETHPVYNIFSRNSVLSSWQWNFTMVPEPYFSADKASDILNFEYLNVPDYTPGFNAVLDDAILTYAIPSQWKNASKVSHTYAAVLNNILQTQQGKAPAVWAYVHNQSLSLFHIADNKLLFANTFQPRTLEDYVYYTLLLYNQLKLNTSAVPLKILGEVQPQSALIEALERYVRHIQFAAYTNGIALHPDVAAQPAHYYYGLFALAECAL